jgi:hypothetical protein
MRSRPLWQLCDTAPERKRGRAAWSKTRSGQPATPLNRGLVGLNGRLVGLPFAAVSHEQRASLWVCSDRGIEVTRIDCAKPADDGCALAGGMACAGLRCFVRFCGDLTSASSNLTAGEPRPQRQSNCRNSLKCSNLVRRRPGTGRSANVA